MLMKLDFLDIGRAMMDDVCVQSRKTVSLVPGFEPICRGRPHAHDHRRSKLAHSSHTEAV